MVRWLGALAVMALVACGGKDDTDSGSGGTTATGGTSAGTPAGTPPGTPTTTDPADDCTFGGTVEGCLAYETTCETPDASYTVAGGWFDDTQAGLMTLRFANNPSDQYWELNIATDEITVDVDYEFPANLTGSLTNVSNPDTTDVTTLCAGRVRITDWEPGVTVSGVWVAQSELGNGPCIDSQYWASTGTFTELQPCRR